MGIYYNRVDNRMATHSEITLYCATEQVFKILSDDDYIYILDTVKGYMNNNGYNDYDDILDITVRYDLSEGQLLTWYALELLY